MRVINPPSKLLRLKHYVEGSVEHHCVGVSSTKL